MPIIRAAEAPTFELHGIHFTGYTSPSRGATEISTWRVQVAPDTRGEAHWLDHEEVFLVLTGTLHISVAGEEQALVPGDALSVPAGTLIQLDNSGEQEATAIVCVPVGTRGTMADGRVVGVPEWAR